LFYGNDGVSFDAAAFAMTAGPALLLLWMRERTGSLVVPVFAHNVVNGVFVLF
jgi:membrane protease YdiL (CAAX protease family)